MTTNISTVLAALYEQHEINPAEEYAQGTELPRPTWEALKLDIAHKDNGCHVQWTLHVVDEI